MKLYKTRKNLRAAAEKEIARFNAETPVGAECRFWTGFKEGPGRISKTQSAAMLHGGETAVVWFECGGGCIALSHVEPIMHKERD